MKLGDVERAPVRRTCQFTRNLEQRETGYFGNKHFCSKAISEPDPFIYQ
jgi:hypothetical protein